MALATSGSGAWRSSQVLAILGALLVASFGGLTRAFPLIPSNGIFRQQRPAHQPPMVGGGACCGNLNGIRRSVGGLLICYVFKQRLARQYQSSEERQRPLLTADGSRQHHPLVDDFIRAAGLKAVTHTRRANQSHGMSVAVAHPRPDDEQAQQQRPPTLTAHGHHVTPAYHHTLFTVSSTASSPLAASLLLPVSEQAGSSSTSSAPSEQPSSSSQGQQLRFWVVARWHKKRRPASRASEQATRYVWQCTMTLPNSSKEVTDEHWVAINMRPFLNRTFTPISFPVTVPLFQPRSQRPVSASDKLHIHVFRSAPGNATQDGVRTEMLDMSEDDDASTPCAQLVTLPCISGGRENLIWEPVLAIASGPAEGANVIQQYNNSRLRRLRPSILDIIPSRRRATTPRRLPQLPSPSRRLPVPRRSVPRGLRLPVPGLSVRRP